MAKRYGLVIDLDRCTGCQTCAVACKVEHNLDQGSGIRVETVGGPRRDTPAGQYPNFSMYYLPVPCMHCVDPPCIPSCPEGAIHKQRDGIVLIDQKKCNSCKACLEACPYQSIMIDPKTERAWKCDLCVHRIKQGLEPFCVNCCEMEAMFFGDIGDPASRVSQLAGKRNAYVLKPELETNPAVRYGPTRPRRE